MPDHRSLDAALTAAIRPPAKCVRIDRRAALDGRARSKLRAMVDAAVASGTSWRELARDIGCTLRHLQDVYSGHRSVPGWMLEGMPDETHEHAIRMWIEQLRKVG